MPRLLLTPVRIVVAACFVAIVVAFTWDDSMWETAFYGIWWIWLALTVEVRWPSKDPADYR